VEPQGNGDGNREVVKRKGGDILFYGGSGGTKGGCPWRAVIQNGNSLLIDERLRGNPFFMKPREKHTM